MTDPRLPRTSTHINLLNNDEISLVDIFRLLKEGREVILGFVLISLIISGGRWLLLPSLYQSNAVIEIGKVANSPIVDTDGLVGEIIHKYGLQEDNLNQKNYITSVNLDSHPLFLTISSTGSSAIRAKSFLETVISKIMLRQKKLYSQEIAIRQAFLMALDSQIRVDKQISSKMIDVSKRDGNSINAILVFREQANILAEIPSLLEKQTNLTLELSKFETWPTRVLEKPTLPSKPTKPNIIRYIALGGSFGVVIGIFAVFVLNIFSSKSANEK